MERWEGNGEMGGQWRDGRGDGEMGGGDGEMGG